MNDLIHEHHDPAPPPAETAEKPEPPVTEHDRQKRVFVYALILFTIAFSLILWTFLMNNRNNQMVLSALADSRDELRTSLAENSGLGTRVQLLEERIQELEAEKEALDAGLAAAEARGEALEAEAREQARTLALLETLTLAARRCAAEEYEEAARLIADWGPSEQAALAAVSASIGEADRARYDPSREFEELLETLAETGTLILVKDADGNAVSWPAPDPAAGLPEESEDGTDGAEDGAAGSA